MGEPSDELDIHVDDTEDPYCNTGTGVLHKKQRVESKTEDEKAEVAVEINTPAWKCSPTKVLADIHMAILALNYKIDKVDETVKSLVHSSVHSTGVSHLSTPPSCTSSGSESTSSFRYMSSLDVDSPFSTKDDKPLEVASQRPHQHTNDSTATDFVGTHVKGAVEEACSKLGLSPNLARVLDNKSNSRKNLASRLVRQVFTKEVREASNVNGLRGKKQLDANRMLQVRCLTFALRPAKSGENEDNLWNRECVKAIDTANRSSKN